LGDTFGRAFKERLFASAGMIPFADLETVVLGQI
jgi:hypothetical protein